MRVMMSTWRSICRRFDPGRPLFISTSLYPVEMSPLLLSLSWFLLMVVLQLERYYRLVTMMSDLHFPVDDPIEKRHRRHQRCHSVHGHLCRSRFEHCRADSSSGGESLTVILICLFYVLVDEGTTLVVDRETQTRRVSIPEVEWNKMALFCCVG